jgi:outer membrane protein assembly factor BamA
MRKALPIALVCVSCIVLAQDQRPGWTDKNNGQMYAAYMLRTTYYERGYMSAQVDVKRSGEEDVFVVNPGPVFHFKDVKIVGLPENLVQQVTKDAPKAGEVYSAGRVSDWIEQAVKQIETARVAQEFAGEEVRLDHAAATANVTILFK